MWYQMIIVSVLFVLNSVKQEIGKLEAQVVYFLHERGAYEVGIEEEEFVCAMQKWYQQNEGKILDRGDIDVALRSLYEVGVVVFVDGNVYLKEKVFGKVE